MRNLARSHITRTIILHLATFRPYIFQMCGYTLGEISDEPREIFENREEGSKLKGDKRTNKRYTLLVRELVRQPNTWRGVNENARKKEKRRKV